MFAKTLADALANQGINALAIADRSLDLCGGGIVLARHTVFANFISEGFKSLGKTVSYNQEVLAICNVQALVPAKR
jgi:hypothetical protein